MSQFPPDLRRHPVQSLFPIALCFVFPCFPSEEVVNGSSRDHARLADENMATSSILQAPHKHHSMSAKPTLTFTLSVSLPAERDNPRVRRLICIPQMAKTQLASPSHSSLSCCAGKKKTPENSLIFMSLYYFSNLKAI